MKKFTSLLLGCLFLSCGLFAQTTMIDKVQLDNAYYELFSSGNRGIISFKNGVLQTPKWEKLQTWITDSVYSYGMNTFGFMTMSPWESTGPDDLLCPFVFKNGKWDLEDINPAWRTIMETTLDKIFTKTDPFVKDNFIVQIILFAQPWFHHGAPNPYSNNGKGYTDFYDDDEPLDLPTSTPRKIYIDAVMDIVARAKSKHPGSQVQIIIGCELNILKDSVFTDCKPKGCTTPVSVAKEAKWVWEIAEYIHEEYGIDPSDMGWGCDYFNSLPSEIEKIVTKSLECGSEPDWGKVHNEFHGACGCYSDNGLGENVLKLVAEYGASKPRCAHFNTDGDDAKKKDRGCQDSEDYASDYDRLTADEYWRFNSTATYETFKYAIQNCGVDRNDGNRFWATVLPQTWDTSKKYYSENAYALSHAYKAVFGINPHNKYYDTATITISVPKGNEKWQPGSSKQITWATTGPITAVKIEKSTDNGNTYSTIVDSTSNDRTYSWTVANTPSLNCLIRISDAPGMANDSSTKFTITSPPSPTGNSFAAPIPWTDPGVTFGSDGWYIGDFNGDGRSDIMRYVPGTGSEVFLSNGSSFIYSGIWTTFGHGADGWYVGDFNGDGRSDIMRYVPNLSGGDVFLSNGSSFIYKGSWTPNGHGADGWYVGDFNGDGRSDIMRYVPGEPPSSEVFLSNGSSFSKNGSWTADGHGTDGWYVGDFNGDGRSDIMRYVAEDAESQVYLSDGTKFVGKGSWTGFGHGYDGWHMGDFNGDSRCDIMRYVPGLAGADVFLASSTNFVYDGNWTMWGRGDVGWYIGDFNGDGRSDLMRYIAGVSGGDVLISTKAGGGSPVGAKLLAAPQKGDKGLWLGAVPDEDVNLDGVEEKAFVAAIKQRIKGEQEVSIYEIQKEYEKLKGRAYRRVEILRLLNHYQWDAFYRSIRE
jgi:hypothetical protein